MAHRDIIVIGASAGGVAALTRLVASLPSDLAAAVGGGDHVRPQSGNRKSHRARERDSRNGRTHARARLLLYMPGMPRIDGGDRGRTDQAIQMSYGPRIHGRLSIRARRDRNRENLVGRAGPTRGARHSVARARAAGAHRSGPRCSRAARSGRGSNGPRSETGEGAPSRSYVQHCSPHSSS